MDLKDVSDEATGLPPITEPLPEHQLMGVQWAVGHESVVKVGESVLAVRYLSVRGLVEDEDGLRWNQVHLAFPSEAVPTLIQQWQATLDADDELQDDDS